MCTFTAGWLCCLEKVTNILLYGRVVNVCGDLDIFLIVWGHQDLLSRHYTLCQSKARRCSIFVSYFCLDFWLLNRVAQNLNNPNQIHYPKTNSLHSVSTLSWSFFFYTILNYMQTLNLFFFLFSHKVAHKIFGMTLIPDRVYCIITFDPCRSKNLNREDNETNVWNNNIIVWIQKTWIMPCELFGVFFSFSFAGTLNNTFWSTSVIY